MPSEQAPQNASSPNNEPVIPPTPQPVYSPSQTPKKDTTLAGILFLVSVLLLCGLIVTFIYKTAKTYKLATPIIASLPATNKTGTLLLEGSAPKNSTVELSTLAQSYTVKAGKDGSFSLPITVENDGKVSISAVARKKILFLNFTSERSAEVSTIVDRVAPTLKIVALPKTVTTSAFTLKGTSSEEATVIIKLNNQEVKIAAKPNEQFSQKLTFKPGKNEIAIKAIDIASNESAEATVNTTYATGSVYIPGGKNTGNLPDSSGELQMALSSVFGRWIALAAVVVGGLGFIASQGVVTIIKLIRKEV